MKDPAIQLNDLEFQYSDTEFNPRDIPSRIQISIPELKVYPGEIAILIGDNGSGKTTLLKLMAGFLKPSQGTIRTTGSPVLVHQKPYIFTQSLWANLAWPLKIQHQPKTLIHNQVSRMMERLQLTHLSRRWAPTLSGGEKQRLAIARALIVSPKILLLDEPTSNIDNSSVKTIERVLLDSSKEGTTIIMSTHNLSTAYRLTTNLISMKSGKIIQNTENIFSGERVPEEDHQAQGTTFLISDQENPDFQPGYIGKFQITNGPILNCPRVNHDCRAAVISMNDIFLSETSINSSAQNGFEGTIVGMYSVDLGLYQVAMDIGVPIAALVTGQSKSKLQLEVGKRIHIAFKASAVRLY